MKIIRSSIVLLLIIYCAGNESCKRITKENTWSNAQKTEWKKNCQQLLIQRGVSERGAIDFCDCMLQKTSEKYTPAEAKRITPDQERVLWRECDYQW